MWSSTESYQPCVSRKGKKPALTSFALIALCLLYILPNSMSLQGIRRISHRVLGRCAGCDCSAGPGLVRTAQYCTTIATPSTITPNKLRAPYTAPSYHPLYSMSSTRLFATQQNETPSTLASVQNTKAKEPSMKDRVKLLWKQYGMISVGTYLGVYVATLSSIFFSLDYDIFNAATFGFDPITAIKKVINQLVLNLINNNIIMVLLNHSSSLQNICIFNSFAILLKWSLAQQLYLVTFERIREVNPDYSHGFKHLFML